MRSTQFHPLRRPLPSPPLLRTWCAIPTSDGTQGRNWDSYCRSPCITLSGNHEILPHKSVSINIASPYTIINLAQHTRRITTINPQKQYNRLITVNSQSQVTSKMMHYHGSHNNGLFNSSVTALLWIMVISAFRDLGLSELGLFGGDLGLFCGDLGPVLW